jgi:rod shape-determining protein MreC
MKKSIFFLLFMLIILFFSLKYFFNFNIYNEILFVQNKIRLYYQEQIEQIENITNKHFNQVVLITNLQKENETLKRKNVSLSYLQTEYNELLKLSNIRKIHKSLSMARMISFVSISSTSKAWIDFKDFNSSKIYGLVYGKYVAGIVSQKDGQPIAILNKDKSCSYSVSIGNKNILGVMIGGVSKISKNIIVDFIPPWKNINIGDKVRTSGLDNIFISNIKVGKVVKVENIRGYKQAIVEPYLESDTIFKYFYIINN